MTCLRARLCFRTGLIRPCAVPLALLILILSGLASPHPATAAAPPPVHIDQCGYTPADTKWVAVGQAAGTFEVRRVIDNGVALAGALTLRRNADPASGDNVYSGDFTSLAAPGEYFVRVPGVGDSPRFLIHAAVYDELFRKALKGLYYQRCGTAIPALYGSTWTHGPCHEHGASNCSYDWATTGGLPGGYRNTQGGWHDAGDYGKYSTNNGYAVGVLLQAYERYPARYAYDDCRIPESGNGVPDLLDEARWSLGWMLTMQEADGSVHHRESTSGYTGMYLPDNDPQPRYYTSISSDATAIQCAAMALAARVYAPFDAGFATACRTSAVNAWNWLLAHPNRVPAGGFVNLYGHAGATYIAGSEVGRRLWAAAELFRLDGTVSAKSYVDAHWGDGLDFNGVWYPDGWGDIANMGAYTYRDTPGATAGIVGGNWWSIQNSLLSSAAGWQARVGQDGYGCAATTGDYYWGFTGVALRYAWVLMEGYRYSGTVAYREAAREQLHYILGRNPMGKVYVTGVGTRPVLHSHGAWNTAGGFTGVADSACRPIPYLLVGGPNSADNGALSPFPGRCYADIADPNYSNLGNYTLNETAVNIQAMLIVTAGYFGTGGTVSAVDEAPPDAARAAGVVAMPNPFTGSTRLRWAPAGGSAAPGPLTEADRTLRIFDVNGRAVAQRLATPTDGATLEVGWDGRDDAGHTLPAGVYFVRSATDTGPGGRIVRVGR